MLFGFDNNEPSKIWGFLKTCFFGLVALNILAIVIPQLYGYATDFLYPKTKIAWIGVNGCIIDSSNLVNEVRFALKNDSIAAVLLKINSRGGSPASSEMIFRELQHLSAKKPIIALVENYCASGAYWIAIAANKIIAQDSSVVGSIGVLSEIPNIKKLLEHINIDYDVISKGEYKTVGHPMSEKMTEKQRKYLQKHIDGDYEIFIEAVASARKLNKADHKTWADGKFFTGRQALEIGLIDKIGALYDAEEEIRVLLKLPKDTDFCYVKYPRPSGLGKILKNEDSDNPPESSSSGFAAICETVLKSVVQVAHHAYA